MTIKTATAVLYCFKATFDHDFTLVLACMLVVGHARWCQEAAWRLRKALPSQGRPVKVVCIDAHGAQELCGRHAFTLLLLELASRGHARHVALHASCFARYESKINEKTPIIGVHRSPCTAADLSAFGIDDSVEWPITEQATQRILTRWTSLGLWENPQPTPVAVQNAGHCQRSSTDNKSIRMTTQQQLILEGFHKAKKEGGDFEDCGQTQPEMKNSRADLAVEACRKHTTALARHSVKERQRRGRIKHCCLNMKSLLPLDPNKRADMASVLEAAVSYLHLVLPLISAQQMQQFSEYLKSNKNYHRVTTPAKTQTRLRPKSIRLLKPNPSSSAEKADKQLPPWPVQPGEQTDVGPSHETQSSVIWPPDPEISHTTSAPPPSHKDIYKPTSIKLIHSRPVVHQVTNPTMEVEPSHWQLHPLPYKRMAMPGSDTCTRLQAAPFSYDSEVSAFVPICSAACKAVTATAVAMPSSSVSSARFVPCHVQSGRAVTPSWLTSSSSFSSVDPLLSFPTLAQSEVHRVWRESHFNMDFGLPTTRPLYPAEVPEVSDKRNAHGEEPLNYTVCNLKVDNGLLGMPSGSTTVQQLQCPDDLSSSTLPTGSHATLLDTQKSQGRGGGAGVSANHLEWDHEQFILKLLYSN